MNKRIKKKIQKSLNYRVKTEKLRLTPGDTVIVKVDTMKEDYGLICIMFDICNKFAESHGCDCLLTTKEIDIDLLDEEQINGMKKFISEWEEKDKENNGRC